MRWRRTSRTLPAVAGAHKAPPATPTTLIALLRALQAQDMRVSLVHDGLAPSLLAEIDTRSTYADEIASAATMRPPTLQNTENRHNDFRDWLLRRGPH